MRLLPSYLGEKERELYKETESGQEVFYYEDDNIIIRNFLPEDATAWCVCMHPEFIRMPILRRKEILKDIRRRIETDLNPEYTSDDVLEFTYMLCRKNGKMFGTMVLKEAPIGENKNIKLMITLFIKEKDNYKLKKETLGALKVLRDKYCWYDVITIHQNDDTEVSLDKELEKYTA